MPNPLNVPITPPRVAFIDPRTGTVSREWYMFFLSLFQLVGGSSVSLVDLQKGPPTLTIDEINAAVSKASENLRPSTESTVEQIAELRKQIEALESQVRPELGTMSQIQQANLPWVTFDTTPQSLPTDIGTVAWDGGTTLGIQMTANVLQPVGEAQYFYIKADSTITKGQLIMFTGAVGASGVIKGAPATGLTDGQYLMGIAAENIATNGFGLVTSFGHVRGWDATGAPVGETWADGDILYYNPSVAGGLTKTQPTAPNVKATIAVVVNAAPAGSGDVFVRVSTGSVLGGTDSNVQFGTLANKDLIQYDSALGYWKNVPATTVGVTSFSAGTTGFTPNTASTGAVTLAGTLGVANGGTGLTSVTANRIPYGNGTSALQTSANLTFDGTNLKIGSKTMPTVTGGQAELIGDCLIFAGDTTIGSPYTQNLQIEITWGNWGSNPAIALVEVAIAAREFGGTAGGAFGWLYALNGGGAAFNTFVTTGVTAVNGTLTAASGGNYVLRITFNPTSDTDVIGYTIRIPTMRGGTGSSVTSIVASLV